MAARVMLLHESGFGANASKSVSTVVFPHSGKGDTIPKRGEKSAALRVCAPKIQKGIASAAPFGSDECFKNVLLISERFVASSESPPAVFSSRGLEIVLFESESSVSIL